MATLDFASGTKAEASEARPEMAETKVSGLKSMIRMNDCWLCTSGQCSNQRKDADKGLLVRPLERKTVGERTTIRGEDRVIYEC
jgi:hypothetical protein